MERGREIMTQEQLDTDTKMVKTLYHSVTMVVTRVANRSDLLTTMAILFFYYIYLYSSKSTRANVILNN